MTPTNDSRPGSPPGPASKITAATKPQDHEQRTAATTALMAFAMVLLGGPSAVFDRLLVKSCPLNCGYAHVHHVPVGSWREPVMRPPRCRPHLRYRVEVTTVVPAARPIVGQRKRVIA
jgi:hypothetical protein